MEKPKQEDIDKAFYMAEKARNNSYSPYSKFKVGVCIKTKTNDFFYWNKCRECKLWSNLLRRKKCYFKYDCKNWRTNNRFFIT